MRKKEVVREGGESLGWRTNAAACFLPGPNTKHLVAEFLGTSGGKRLVDERWGLLERGQGGSGAVTSSCGDKELG